MSLVAYPVFFSGPADRRRFSEMVGQGRGLVSCRPSAGELGRVMVVTDEADVADWAMAAGIEVRLVPLEDEEDLPGLPRGARTAVRLLLAGEVGLVGGEGAVAVVDYRNPDVTPKVIAGILAEVHRQPGLWVGLSEVDDHPVQFDVHLETVEAELHLYADPDAEKGLAMRASRPFPLNLAGLGQAGRNGFLRVPPDGLGADFEPVSVLEARREAAGRGVVMEYVGDGRGRRLLGRGAPWPRAALIPFAGCLEESGLLVQPAADGEGLDVHARPLVAGAYRLSVFAVADGEVGKNPAWGTWLSFAAPMPAVIMAGGRGYTAALAQAPVLHGDGLLAVLERQTGQGHAERTMALSMEGGGWEAGEDLSRVNLAKGRRIMGRQDFSEVWELDGSVLAADAAGLAGLLSPAFPEGARGYPLGACSAAGRAVRLGLPLPSSGPGAARAGESRS